jgi:hypothetical protein
VQKIAPNCWTLEAVLDQLLLDLHPDGEARWVLEELINNKDIKDIDDAWRHARYVPAHLHSHVHVHVHVHVQVLAST